MIVEARAWWVICDRCGDREHVIATVAEPPDGWRVVTDWCDAPDCTGHQRHICPACVARDGKREMATVALAAGGEARNGGEG